MRTLDEERVHEDVEPIHGEDEHVHQDNAMFESTEAVDKGKKTMIEVGAEISPKYANPQNDGDPNLSQHRDYEATDDELITPQTK
ncbi:hypothetical protein Cni_G23224 [Canna indica]|uniref:Uncharacterized protein n=1 Tax=Canna indica TaxID=4628 RepID=A0AAQ3QK95_9LILI|nr:hypothetical protein Cni_G23224 [Canna indica]